MIKEIKISNIKLLGENNNYLCDIDEMNINGNTVSCKDFNNLLVSINENGELVISKNDTDLLLLNANLMCINYSWSKVATDLETVAISIDELYTDYLNEYNENDIKSWNINNSLPIEIDVKDNNSIIFFATSDKLDINKIYLNVKNSAFKSYGEKTFIDCGKIKITHENDIEELYLYRTYYTYNSGKYCINF